MCRLIGLQLLRGGDTNITFIFIVKRIQCCAVPSPKQLSTEKKIYSFDVMLSELVFSFMLKFEVKKKKESELVGFFGGVFPARTGICVSAWNCSLRFIYSLTLKSCDNAY